MSPKKNVGKTPENGKKPQGRPAKKKTPKVKPSLRTPSIIKVKIPAKSKFENLLASQNFANLA